MQRYEIILKSSFFICIFCDDEPLFCFFCQKSLDFREKVRTFAPAKNVLRLMYMGESYTASSLGIPQDGNIARVLGCSGAI